MLASLATIMKEKTALVTSMVYFALTSRLASNAVVSSLFDGASTHRTIYPYLDARSDPNVVN